MHSKHMNLAKLGYLCFYVYNSGNKEITVLIPGLIDEYY